VERRKPFVSPIIDHSSGHEPGYHHKFHPSN
jgi:hypothetical protein